MMIALTLALQLNNAAHRAVKTNSKIVRTPKLQVFLMGFGYAPFAAQIRNASTKLAFFVNVAFRPHNLGTGGHWLRAKRASTKPCSAGYLLRACTKSGQPRNAQAVQVPYLDPRIRHRQARPLYQWI